MSLRETAGTPPIMALHRYWIYSNRMRECFEAELEKDQQKITNLRDANPAKAMGAAAAFLIGPGVFMSYWYGSLYVVIEGWRQLQLNDPKIDSLLSSPNVRLLKKYRDGIFHFQRNYFDDRFGNFIKSADSVLWVRAIHSNLANIFVEKSRRLTPQLKKKTKNATNARFELIEWQARNMSHSRSKRDCGD